MCKDDFWPGNVLEGAAGHGHKGPIEMSWESSMMTTSGLGSTKGESLVRQTLGLQTLEQVYGGNVVSTPSNETNHSHMLMLAALILLYIVSCKKVA